MKNCLIIPLTLFLLLPIAGCRERSTDNPLWSEKDNQTETEPVPIPATAPVTTITPAPIQDIKSTPQQQQPDTLPGSPVPVDKKGQVFSFADLVEEVVPSVVNISTTRLVQPRRPDKIYLPLKNEEDYGLSNRRIIESLGSGFIIDPDGYVLTSLHVVSEATTIRLRLHDGRELDGKVVGRDPKTDIALLKMNNSENLKHLELGDSSALRVGDWVIAIGNPFGLSGTVTAGIISAVGRKDLSLSREVDYTNFIQTDASINPGNSGGPLINIEGKVVGVNTAISRKGQGIGFAIPINMAKVIIPQLKTLGRVARSYLGVYIDHVPELICQQLGWDKPRGAMVSKVIKDGPAHIAGLRLGDIILSFDNQEIREADDLPWLVSTAGIGKNIPLTIMRGPKQIALDVVMGESPTTDKQE